LLTSTGILKVATAPVTPPVIGNIAISGTNIVVSGSGGAAGGTYYVLSSTNVAAPRTNWIRMATNVFGPGGSFVFTNALDSAAASRFYLLQVP
jgi:hypothetical protein